MIRVISFNDLRSTDGFSTSMKSLFKFLTNMAISRQICSIFISRDLPFRDDILQSFSNGYKGPLRLTTSIYLVLNLLTISIIPIVIPNLDCQITMLPVSITMTHGVGQFCTDDRRFDCIVRLYYVTKRP
jgi:hypothetical protein